jgi:endonuclease YncB( thermonuclease family)
VGAADGLLRAVVPGDPEYEPSPWLRCFASVEEAGRAGFALATPGVASAASPTTRPAATTAAEETVTVVRVVDAATIEVRFADGRVEVVRYIGVDAPAVCAGVPGMAQDAALVAGRTVRLERDVSERDRQERLLRYVWVVGDDGVSRLVNEEALRGGHAIVAIQPPDVRYEQRLRDAEREAHASGRGLWSSCAAQLVPPVTATAPPPAPTPTSRPPTTTPVPPAPPTAAPPTQAPPAPPTATAVPPAPTATQRAATATRVPPTATRVPPSATRASACHPSYPTLCLPGAPDLDCKDIPQKAFPVRPPDPHGLDGDDDGIGCEN